MVMIPDRPRDGRVIPAFFSQTDPTTEERPGARRRGAGRERRMPWTLAGWCLVVVMPGMWALSSSALGLTGDLTNDPTGVIDKYLSLDQRGARLTAQSYEAVAPYVAWKGEPAWEHLVVIRDYAVADDVTQWDVVSGTEAMIPVTFQVLGVVHWETATFVPEPREDVVSIRIRAVDNFWRMIEPMFPPHVGRQRLADFVQDAILDETNEDRVAVLRRLNDDLVKAGQ